MRPRFTDYANVRIVLIPVERSQKVNAMAAKGKPAPPNKQCESLNCPNSSKRTHKFCSPCESRMEHEKRRRSVYTGEEVSSSDWNDIAAEDEADAMCEAYKWALRDGANELAAQRSAHEAGNKVLALYRQARKSATHAEKRSILDQLSAGNEARRAGQMAAAAMIGQAAQQDIQSQHSETGKRNRTALSNTTSNVPPPRPADDMCGAPTLSGEPCQNPAPTKGSKCGSGHIPVNHKRERITLSTLKSRGWTPAMIRDVLGPPDAEAPNPHYSQGAPMKLYYLHRVEAAERTEEFLQAKLKADKRRSSAQKGLNTRRVTEAAESVIAEATAQRRRQQQRAQKLIERALDVTSTITTQEREALRQSYNAITNELGYPLCVLCGWNHIDIAQCPPDMKQIDNEAQLAAQVSSIFADVQEATAFIGRNSPSASNGLVRWSPEQTPEYYSKSEVRRQTGWTTRQIKAKLGQPDRVLKGTDTTVNLYRISRVESVLADTSE